MFVLCSCGGYSTGSVDTQTVSGGGVSQNDMEADTVSTGAISGSAASSKKKTPVMLQISVSPEHKVTIPDPAVTGDVVPVQLQSEDVSDVWYDYTEEERASCYADLSFAGFKEEVLVASATVGFVGKKDSSAAQIIYADKKKEKKGKKGNCLVLLVSEGIDREEEYLGGIGTNYLLVIDYENHTYYKTETKFWIDDNKFQFVDLTGDGRDELLIQCRHNKWIDFEVWRFDEEKQKMKELYSDFNKEDTDSFSGHLENNYKVVIKYGKIGFSQTISMLDAGYKESDLQVNKAPDWDALRFVQLWKDGVLQKDQVNKDTVFLYSLDKVSVVDNGKKLPQIKLERPLMVGHRSQCLGDVYTFFQYDRKKDKLVLKDAKFKLYSHTY
ncbi:MAG: hypothetical protein NC293_13295 [Roseburia sp.]|nr:hypothetical protein [Roseburia sp.]